MQDYEDSRKIIEDQLRQIELGSHRLEISFAEFKEIFGLILRSSFVNEAAKELLRESFLRLEDRFKNELKNNENGYTTLMDWFSFDLCTPSSEMVDTPADKARVANSYS